LASITRLFGGDNVCLDEAILVNQNVGFSPASSFLIAMFKSFKDLPQNQVMGKVMNELRGKAPGKLISTLVRQLIE
jgi:hypothetical protein